ASASVSSTWQRVQMAMASLLLMRAQRASSVSRKPTSKGALWITSSAPSMNSSNRSATSPKRGLLARSASRMPCTCAAPSSISRPGLRYSWKCRPVGRRLTSSTQPISMMRWPSLGSRPVVSVSSTTCRKRASSHVPSYPKQRVDGLVGELVGALVARIAGVSAHPAPGNAMSVTGRIQRLPQVLVLHRLPVRGAPAARLPGRQPLLDAGAHVLRVGVQRDLDGTLQRAQRLDGRGEFHAVVGGLGIGARDLAAALAGDQHGAPPSRPRVAPAGAVRVDGHLGHEVWRRVGSGSALPNTGR